MQRVNTEMSGASNAHEVLAAYSQILSGLAEGLSNNNATPAGYPGQMF
jgi:hypothetical protein